MLCREEMGSIIWKNNAIKRNYLWHLENLIDIENVSLHISADFTELEFWDGYIY